MANRHIKIFIITDYQGSTHQNYIEILSHSSKQGPNQKEWKQPLLAGCGEKEPAS